MIDNTLLEFNKMIVLQKKLYETGMSTLYKAIINDNNDGPGKENSLYFVAKVSKNKDVNLKQEQWATQMIENNSEASVVIPVLFVVEESSAKYAILQFKRNGYFLNELIPKLEEDFSGIKLLYLQLEIIRNILKSLRHIHHCFPDGSGYLHLDIQPCNIFIENSNLSAKKPHIGTAKFIDFQSAVEVDPYGNAVKRKNAFFFTDGYTAPEIINEDIEKLSYGTDLYSVGAIFYRILYGKNYEGRIDSSDLLPEDSNLIRYQVLNILENTLERNPHYRYQNIDDILLRVEQTQELLLNYKEKEYYPLYLNAYHYNVPARLINEENLKFDPGRFKEAVKKLESVLLRSSRDNYSYAYILEGLWNLCQNHLDEVETDIQCSLVSSAISIYNTLGNTTKSYYFCQIFEKLRGAVPIQKYLNIQNRIAVIYADNLEFEKAYSIIKLNIESLKEIKSAFKKVALINDIDSKDALDIKDLARSYSALGCYSALAHIGDPMEYFERAIKEFGNDSGNKSITYSHILHYACMLGGAEGEKLYRQYAACYFENCKTPSEQYEYAMEMLEKKRLEYPMHICLKGLYHYYLKDIDDELYKEICDDFINGRFPLKGEDPLELIYRYLGLIFYSKNGNQIDELAADAFNQSMICIEECLIDEDENLNIYMLINYHTMHILNELTDRKDKNKRLKTKLLKHAEESGWKSLSELLSDHKKPEEILNLYYC